MQVDHIPSELISQYTADIALTASSIFDCATRTQGHVFTIHGPASEHESKESFDKINSGKINSGKINSGKANIEGLSFRNDQYCQPGQIVHLNEPEKDISIILSGLSRNTILVHNKINHILIRRSDNLDLHLINGTVSGIDILYSQSLRLKTPHHNSTNIEFSQTISLDGEITDVSRIHITGSLEIKINGIPIPINPFLNFTLKKDGIQYEKPLDNLKLMISQ